MDIMYWLKSVVITSMANKTAIKDTKTIDLKTIHLTNVDPTIIIVVKTNKIKQAFCES